MGLRALYQVLLRSTTYKDMGCLKLQVIFRKRATNYRALLWKMTYKGKEPYGSSRAVSGFLAFNDL